MKGKKRSEETKRKISLANRGRKHTEEARQKNAEVLGYKLTGKSDIKPIKEKSKVTK